MSIQISPETEACLIAEARKQGISVDALLDRLLREATVTAHAAETGSRSELPLWHLGGAGDLHRRDIYDDER